MKQITLIFHLIIFFTCTLQAQQTAKLITATNGEKIGFLEAKPSDYGKQLHPVIIFLHGIDERGNGTTDIQKVTKNGIAKITRLKTIKVKGSSFVILSPQLDKKFGAWENFYIEEMLNYAKTLHIDTNRIYLTGISLGGGAAWNFASLDKFHAEQFAAIVPVCGVCYYDYQKIRTIAKASTPVWAFVGGADKSVNPLCTTQAVDAINANQPVYKAKQTIYKGVGHNSWDRAYDTTHRYQDPNVFEWMLQYKRQAPKK